MKSITFNNSLILTKNLISALPEKDKNFSFIIVKVDGENKTPHHQNLIENILKKNTISIFFFFRFQKIE